MKRMVSRKLGGSRKARGYVLLTLLLWVAILSITVAASLELRAYYKLQIKRDQEEELVHRGVEYERAIRKYFRKFGSYPPSVELLESSNHMRFLRRRYKDPINGKDFKVLHQADVMQLFAAGIGGGGGIAGAETVGQQVSALSAPPPPANNPGDNNTGDNASGTNTSGSGAMGTGSSSGDSGSSQQSSTSGSGTTLPFTAISGQSSSSQTFGGGGIVGVASISPEESVRVFNKKNHYNEWLFAYNPSMDRGGLPRGPYEPTLQAILPGQLGMQPGQNGLPQGLGQPGLGQPGAGQPVLGQPGSMGPGMPAGNQR